MLFICVQAFTIYLHMFSEKLNQTINHYDLIYSLKHKKYSKTHKKKFKFLIYFFVTIGSFFKKR